MPGPSATAPTRDLLAAASKSLIRRVDDLATEMAYAIHAQEPQYQQTVSYADLRTRNRDNLAATLTQLSQDHPLDLTAARRTAARRAQQGIPLPSVLRAFHIGTNLAWVWLVEYVDGDSEAARLFLPAATELWNLNDLFCQEVTAAYRDTIATRRQHESQHRAVTLSALLNGEIGAGIQSRDCAQLLDLPPHGPYVIVATPRNPRQDHRDLERALSQLGTSSIWLDRPDEQVGLLPLPPELDLPTVAVLLRDHTAGRAGISAPFSELQTAPVAVRQARKALAATTSSTHPVVCYDDAPLAVLLATDTAMAEHLTNTVLGSVLRQPPRERDLLLTTLRVWYDAAGSTSAAARILQCHRNTVLNRLHRVTQLTGLDLAAPSATAHLYMALEAHRLTTG